MARARAARRLRSGFYLENREESSVARKRSFARSFLRTTVVLVIAAAVAPSASQAGLLGTGAASNCDTEASQPFLPWSDDALYVLVAGGSFEAGTPAWTLGRGATVVPGNEPFYVRGASDSRSLLLPGGSSAISPTVCFALGDWHLRFFVRKVNAQPGSLEVDIVVKSVLGGVLSILDGGTVSASGEWEPSPRIGLLLSNVGCLAGTRAVSFRFRARGDAAFQIDDVYLDPWKFG
jgi:hypothetical protein